MRDPSAFDGDSVRKVLDELGMEVSLVSTAPIALQDGLNLPPIVVPFPMRALEPWTTGEAERSPEAMVLLYRVQEAGSPMNCAA